MVYVLHRKRMRIVLFSFYQIVKNLKRTYSYFVKVSREDVYIVPPTSMWTGAVYLEAAATQGIPVIFWL